MPAPRWDRGWAHADHHGCHDLAGLELSVDATSAVELGNSGTYVAGELSIDSGGTLAGSGLIEAAVANNGIIDALGSNLYGTVGTLDITGLLLGTGTVDLTVDSILKLGATVAFTQTINFETGSATLILPSFAGQGPDFSARITNLQIGDRIEAPGIGQITNAKVTSPGTITVTTTTGNFYLNNVSFAPGFNPAFYWYVDASTGDRAIQVAPVNLTWLGGSGDLGMVSTWNTDTIPNST